MIDFITFILLSERACFSSTLFIGDSGIGRSQSGDMLLVLGVDMLDRH